MTRVNRTLDAPYSADDLFDLVADVRRYPEFVKWMQRLVILSESGDDQSRKLRADARVGFRGFNESFVTDVTADRQARSVSVSLVRGPFRRLETHWRFAQAEKGTGISFDIDFEFRNPVLQALASANLDFAVSRIVQSFLDEAKRRYRPANAPTDQAN